MTVTFATSANADSAEAVTLVSLFKDFETKTPGVKIDLQPIPMSTRIPQPRERRETTLETTYDR